MRSISLILTLVGLLAFVPSAKAAIIPVKVTSADDSGPDTLRQAILDANAQAANGVPHILIELDGNDPITLQSSLPTLTATAVEIRGALVNPARISGQHLYPIFVLEASVLLFRMANVELLYGRSNDFHAGCLDISGDGDTGGFFTLDDVAMVGCGHHAPGAARGGAVRSLRNLTIRDSVFVLNQVTGTTDVGGGAVAVMPGSSLDIENSYFGSNTAITRGGADTNLALGGAVLLQTGSSLSIQGSMFSSNEARAPDRNDPTAALGGAIFARLTGAAEIAGTAFRSNVANTGGAIYHRTLDFDTTLVLSNCSIYGNIAATGSGGGLFGANTGTLSLRNNTFWKNSADVAGDNLAAGTTSYHIDSAYNNLFAAGEGVGDSCHDLGSPTSSGYNIVPAPECGMGTQSGDQITTEPHIRGAYMGPGLTFTVELYATSPALDAGNPIAPDDDVAGACLETDTLGQPRPVDASATGAPARCDIGALEAQSEPSLFIDDFSGLWLRP